MESKRARWMPGLLLVMGLAACNAVLQNGDRVLGLEPSDAGDGGSDTGPAPSEAGDGGSDTGPAASEAGPVPLDAGDGGSDGSIVPSCTDEADASSFGDAEDLADDPDAGVSLVDQVRRVIRDVDGTEASADAVNMWTDRIEHAGWTTETMRQSLAHDPACETAIRRVYSDAYDKGDYDGSEGQVEPWEVTNWVDNLSTATGDYHSIATMRAAFVGADQCAIAIRDAYQASCGRASTEAEIAAARRQILLGGGVPAIRARLAACGCH